MGQGPYSSLTRVLSRGGTWTWRPCDKGLGLGKAAPRPGRPVARSRGRGGPGPGSAAPPWSPRLGARGLYLRPVPEEPAAIGGATPAHGLLVAQTVEVVVKR